MFLATPKNSKIPPILRSNPFTDHFAEKNSRPSSSDDFSIFLDSWPIYLTPCKDTFPGEFRAICHRDISTQSILHMEIWKVRMPFLRLSQFATSNIFNGDTQDDVVTASMMIQVASPQVFKLNQHIDFRSAQAKILFRIIQDCRRCSHLKLFIFVILGRRDTNHQNASANDDKRALFSPFQFALLGIAD